MSETDTTEKPAAKVSTGRNAAPTVATKSEKPAHEDIEEVIPQSYVWLANGEVVLANNEDLPGVAGVNNPFGHWIKDGHAFEIVGVYSKEEKVG